MDILKVLRSDESGFCYDAENQPFSGNFYYSSPCYDLDEAKESHEILGFGAAMTDATGYLLSRLSPEKRSELLNDFLSPEKLGLSMIRLNAGSSDYATTAYNYDDVPGDYELKHFSVAHDEKWIIPCLQESLKIRPDLYFFSAPWSPPGWMKTSGSMCGGYMRAKFLPVYADYLVKYLQEYQKQGIDIQALSVQNEPETDQGGTMPQSLLHPDFEMELVGHLMPSRLAAAGLKTKLWLYDHNYGGWQRVLYMLSDPEVRKYTDAVAFHPYSGKPEMMNTISRQYPGMRFQVTESAPWLRNDTPQSSILWWTRAITGALNNGCSSFTGWNFVLDENGMPNLGKFDAAGMVEIHSRTQEITPSVQYHAFRHYAPFIRRGAKLLSAPLNFPADPELNALIVRNPDNSIVIVASNSGDGYSPKSLQFKYQGKYLKLLLPKKSVITLKFDKDLSQGE